MRDLIGRQIGPYEIREAIGGGGMATVYRAFQPSLNRDVAVKVLRASLADDEEFVQRFRREAMAAGGLRHPNILRIYDAGTFESLHYIVMDYVSGGTLAKRLQTGKIPIEDAVELTAQVAEALDYAHARGIVHRDLKPSNILMDEDGRPLLTDFGIAYIMSSEHRLTQTGASLGTPEYMSPEQSEGLPVDGRTDIYSLGIVLYHMATGRIPFQANTPMGTMYQTVHQPPPPPRDFNPAVPDWLETVILRSLAKNPADRFSTGKEMAQALRDHRPVPVPETPLERGGDETQVYRGGSTVQRPPTQRRVPVTPPQPQRRGRGGLVAVLAVAVVALLGSTGYLARNYFLHPSVTQPTTTSQPLAMAEPTSAPPAASDTPVRKPAQGGLVTATPPEGAVALAVESTATTLPTQEPTSEPSATPEPEATVTAAVSNSPTTEPTAEPKPTASPEPTEPPVDVSAASSASPGTVLDFESLGTWVLGDEHYGTLTSSSDIKHSGQHAAKLAYDIPAVQNNYVVFMRRPPVPIPGKPSALTLWVYGDGSGHFLNVWVQDSQGEVRQFSFGRIQHSGAWQAMTAPLDVSAPWPQQHISGPDNGKLDYPLSLVAFVFDAVPDGGGPFKGTVYLDDLATGQAPATQPTAAAQGAPATAAPASQATAVPATAVPQAAAGPVSGRIVFPQAREGRVDIMAVDAASGNTWLVFTNGSQPALRSDGRVVFNGIGGGKNNLIAVDIGGGSETFMSNHPEDSYPSWSPSGRSVVYYSSMAGGQDHLYTLPDSAHSQEPKPLQISGQPILGRFPVWLANWRVAYLGCGYQWGQGDWCGIWSVNSDDSGGPARVTEDANDHPTAALGGNLLFSRQNGGNWDVYVVPETGGAARNLTNSPSQDFGASFSPDGRSVAFMSDRDGWGIWVMNADGSSPRKLLAAPNGFGSNWPDEHLSWGP